MDQVPEEIFNQYCVTLKKAPVCYVDSIAKSGTVNVWDYKERGICFDWVAEEFKFVELTGWSIVVQEEDPEPENALNSHNDSNSPTIRTFSVELKHLQTNGSDLSLVDLKDSATFTYTFSGNSLESFIQFLLRANYIRQVRKHCYRFVDFSDRDKLQRSFAELNINEIRHSKPKNVGYADFAMELFAKVPTLLRKGDESSPPSPTFENDGRFRGGGTPMDTSKREIMIRSLSEIEPQTYLPPRTEVQRAKKLTLTDLKSFQSADGRYHNVADIKQIIFHGGIDESVRPIVWKLILEYDRWEDDHAAREIRRSKLTDDYYRMKRQWTSISMEQEDNFNDFREHKCQIEKDVKRTDRHLAYFEGDDNPNLIKLNNVLMTYVMFNFNMGYVQGMSDLLAPILQIMDAEEDSFWCFVGFMKRMQQNYIYRDQRGIFEQFTKTKKLLRYMNPQLYAYLLEQGAENMFYLFRWLIVWFKREFENDDIMVLWEVLWTDLPCQNFQLFIALAILEQEQDVIIGENLSFTDILKHINELSNLIDLDNVLCRAESIYIQVVGSSNLPNEIREIMGLPLVLPKEEKLNDENGTDNDSEADNVIEQTEAIESSYENGINSNFY